MADDDIEFLASIKNEYWPFSLTNIMTYILIADLCRISEMTGEVFIQISRFESVNLVFGFEQLFGQSCLARLSEIGGADAMSCRVGHGLGEDVGFHVGERGDIHIGAAVEKMVVAFDTFPQTGLKKKDRLLESQRFGVVDCGFGADEKTGFVVLLDGVASEPVFDAGVVVVESPEGLGL